MSKKGKNDNATVRGSTDVAANHAAPSQTLDAGRIRTGAGCRIRLLTTRTADSGKVRIGAGCRIRLLAVA